MFKDWSKTKIALWVIGIVILVAAIYNWKWIAMKLGYDPNTRKFCGGGLIWPNAYAPVIATYEQGGIVTPGCGGNSATTNTGIPIERVPVR